MSGAPKLAFDENQRPMNTSMAPTMRPLIPIVSNSLKIDSFKVMSFLPASIAKFFTSLLKGRLINAPKMNSKRTVKETFQRYFLFSAWF